MALKKQLDEFQKKAEDQEGDLRKLRLELSESRMAQGDVVRGFQELIQVQNEQFQELTDSFSRFFAGRRTDKVDQKKL
jgi:energy-converting hydrogenase A subunit M